MKNKALFENGKPGDPQPPSSHLALNQTGINGRPSRDELAMKATLIYLPEGCFYLHEGCLHGNDLFPRGC